MELAILVGLPGAGKSTFARTHLADHLLVSKDLLKSDRDRRQRELVEAALRAGRSVVIDNTNATVAERAALVALAHAYGARAIAYHFAETPKACVARNAARQGRTRVPAVAIFTTARRMQAPVVGEGFDEVRTLTVAAGGGFEIR